MTRDEPLTQPKSFEASILLVDDSPDILAGLEAILKPRYRSITRAQSAQEAIAALAAARIDIVVTDIAMPGMDGLELLTRIRAQSPKTLVIVITGFGSVESAVEAMKRGAYHYVAKPFRADEILIQVERAIQRILLEREVEDLRSRVADPGGFHGIIAQSKKMYDLFDFVRKVAPTDAPVMIRGESGTGKELFARALHMESNRQQAAFLGINTAALPEQLLEAELFGYKRGAFTGAVADKVGHLSAARRGTIFLDEIGGMPLACQAKLLRAIEEMEVLPLGGLVPEKVDVRFISATNRDRMEGMREDLFYRLAVMEIRISPLRERLEDVPLLAAHFVESYARRFGKWPKHLGPEALEVLMSYRWPGNVRELENVIQRAVVVSSGERIAAVDVHVATGRDGDTAGAVIAAPYEQARDHAIAEFQRQFLRSLLKKTGGNISRAARSAKVTRAALYAMMKRTGIVARKSIEEQDR
jgi:two-component system response regulator PilR (NtrC family)/two-component system response regulator HydG